MHLFRFPTTLQIWKSVTLANSQETITSIDILKLQMEDMLHGSTIKAYQLASPSNRQQTANKHDMDMFDRIRSDYRSLLNATDYAYTRSHKKDCAEAFDVLLYGYDSSMPTHGYKFLLSRQNVKDTHPTLGEHKLPIDSQYWHTDGIVEIPENSL